jgi:hypothetical protein
MCLCIPLNFLGLCDHLAVCLRTPPPTNIRRLWTHFAAYVSLYVVRVVSKENGRLVLPRTFCIFHNNESRLQINIIELGWEGVD